MTTKEQRDYIAIQAMTAMIHNESMMVDKASQLRNTDCDDDDCQAVDQLVEAAYNIAEMMMDEGDRREKESIDENQSS